MPDSSQRRERTVRRRFSAFLDEQGLASDLVSPEAIEAFLAIGLHGRATSTAGTYRSVLRSEGTPTRSGRPYRAGRAPLPYSPNACAELFAMARSQRLAWRRESALALLFLSLGAGLRPGEIVSARGPDVFARGGVVEVSADKRQVRVQAPYRRPLWALARRRGEAHLFHPGEADRDYPNFVSDFTAHLRRPQGTAPPSVGRARTTFICAHLAAGTSLGVLLAETGIVDVASLLRYCRHVPDAPSSKAELRARWRAERLKAQ